MRVLAILHYASPIMTLPGTIYLMIIAQQLVEKVDGVIADKALVFRVDEAVPILLREPPKDIIILCIKFDVIFVKILEQIVSAQNLSNFDELI